MRAVQHRGHGLRRCLARLARRVDAYTPVECPCRYEALHASKSIFTRSRAALRFNRQRSILTSISLAWGVACFVILYSYGEGFHVALLDRLSQPLARTWSLMFGGQTSTQAGGERAGRRIRLEFTDVEAIRESVPTGRRRLAGSDDTAACQVVRGLSHANDDGPRRVRTAYGRIRNQTMQHGPLDVSPEDEMQRQPRRGFGRQSGGEAVRRDPARGEEITINGLRFTVIGVLKTKTQISNYNTPDNECSLHSRTHRGSAVAT